MENIVLFLPVLCYNKQVLYIFTQKNKLIHLMYILEVLFYDNLPFYWYKGDWNEFISTNSP